MQLATQYFVQCGKFIIARGEMKRIQKTSSSNFCLSLSRSLSILSLREKKILRFFFFFECGMIPWFLEFLKITIIHMLSFFFYTIFTFILMNKEEAHQERYSVTNLKLKESFNTFMSVFFSILRRKIMFIKLKVSAQIARFILI